MTLDKYYISILLCLLPVSLVRAQNVPDIFYSPMPITILNPKPPDPHGTAQYSRVVKSYPRYPAYNHLEFGNLDESQMGRTIYVKDGFNNTIQTRQKLAAKTGNQWKDVIQLHDNRNISDAYQFLPYSIDSDWDYIDRQSYTNQKDYYAGHYPNEGYSPYSITRNSSDNNKRSFEQYAPGKMGVGFNRKSVTQPIDHTANTVRIWDIDGNGLPAVNGYYLPQTLLAMQTGGEHNALEQTFTDFDGRLIMKRTADSLAGGTYYWQTTCYVYDDMGQLRFIIPPKAYQVLSENLWTMTTDISNDLCFRYDYDTKGRLIATRKPGEKQLTSLVYDKHKRIVMRQSALEKTRDQWEVIYYDNYDRPIATSLYESSNDRAYWQNQADNGTPPSANTNLLYYLTHDEGMGTAPAETAVTGNTMMSYLYYDNYEGLNNIYLRGHATDKLNFPNDWITTGQAPITELPRQRAYGLPTYSKNRIITAPGADDNTTGTWQHNVSWYGDRGLVVQSMSFTTKGTDTIYAHYNAQQYDFVGRNILSKHIAVNNRSDDAMDEHTEFIRNYYDDNTGQLTKTTHKVNGGAWFPLAAYTYDNLGRVSREVLGLNGETRDYTYNIRGQLEGINAHYAETANKQGQVRTFGEKLYYDEGFTSERYDGKISGMIWRGGNSNLTHAYGYTYDISGRLKAADYRRRHNGAVFPNIWGNSDLDYSVAGLYYDKNGNLLNMKQRSATINGPEWIDDLSYTYAPNSNELIAVADDITVNYNKGDFQDGNTTGDDYEYDASGNLTKDKNKGIASVVYTYFNKPQEITFDNGSKILYSYTAGGENIQEVHIDNVNTVTTRTDNVGNFIYKDDKLRYALTQKGRTIINTTSGTGKEEFFLKDHLGNIRSIVDYYRQSAHVYLGTYEVASAHVEGLIFNNHVFISDLNPDPVPGDVMAGRLNGSETDYRTGSALLLQVMSGDKIDLSVEGLYDLNDLEEMGSPADWADMFDALMNSLMSGTGGTGMGEGASNPGLIGELVQPMTYMNYIQHMQDSLADTTKPRAFLNYVFFDENNQVVNDKSGFIQITSNGNWQEVGTANILEPDMNGHIAIWLSNASAINVYVNNLTVSVTKGNLLEENSYYPHGLRWQNTTFTTHVPNRHQYQGNEYREELGLNWQNFHARQYDPQIGRFLSIDPLAAEGGQDKYSPFAAMGNNPAMMIDPGGTIFFLSGSTPLVDGGMSPEAMEIFMRWDRELFAFSRGDWGSAGSGSSGGGGGMDRMLAMWENNMSYYVAYYQGQKFWNDFRETFNNINTNFSVVNNNGSFEYYPFIGFALTDYFYGNRLVNGGTADVMTGAIASNGSNPVAIAKRSSPLGWIAEIFEGLFTSAHVPNWAAMPFLQIGTLDAEAVKAAVRTAKFQKRENVTGSYTITFDNGHKYHGKGSITRMTVSATEKMAAFGIKVTMLDWTPANSHREAFKAEYRRMQTDAVNGFSEGVDNPINYNIIQSPGKAYIQQDGY